MVFPMKYDCLEEFFILDNSSFWMRLFHSPNSLVDTRNLRLILLSKINWIFPILFNVILRVGIQLPLAKQKRRRKKIWNIICLKLKCLPLKKSKFTKTFLKTFLFFRFFDWNVIPLNEFASSVNASFPRDKFSILFITVAFEL